MKHEKIERLDLPKRLPPRWMVAPHSWPEIALREQQSSYHVSQSFDDLTLEDLLTVSERDR